MDEESHVGVKREKEQEVKFSGVQMETGECDRALFHECLLKAPSGRGHMGSRISQSVPAVACSLGQCPSIILACPVWS